MADILVTGSLSFIGPHFTEKLYKVGHDLIVLDHLSNGFQHNLSHLKNTITIYFSNVEQIKSTIFDNKFEIIFSLAIIARSSNLLDPFQNIEPNYEGTVPALELAKKENIKVIFTSNSCIYGSKDNNSSIDENSVTNSTTPYDANTLVSKFYYQIYYDISNVHSAVVLFATGERQSVNQSLNWKPVVATFVTNLSSNENVTINGDSEQSRELLYVSISLKTRDADWLIPNQLKANAFILGVTLA
jgi:nucleoside-diphosphate-sugar epimerase